MVSYGESQPFAHNDTQEGMLEEGALKKRALQEEIIQRGYPKKGPQEGRPKRGAPKRGNPKAAGQKRPAKSGRSRVGKPMISHGPDARFRAKRLRPREAGWKRLGIRIRKGFCSKGELSPVLEPDRPGQDPDSRSSKCNVHLGKTGLGRRFAKPAERPLRKPAKRPLRLLSRRPPSLLS
jgi:hypothetical protein